MDNLNELLLSKVFRNLANLADFQNCRCVSKKWRCTVMTACQSKFHLVYPLTDSTILCTTSQLKDTPVSFEIYSFTGKENQEAWGTSGIAPLMETTEWLQFSGSEIDAKEIRKILGFAINSLKIVSFKCKKKDLACPFLDMQENFSALRKVSLGYNGIQNDNDTFNTFTRILEKWTSLQCGVQIPLMESLHLYYDGRAGTGYPKVYTYMPIRITSEDLFRNYLAIAKLMLKYKQTLREVKIERVSYKYFYGYYYSFSKVVPSEWAEMERGLEALDEMSLNRLEISHKPAYTNTTDTYAGVLIELSGRLRDLKNILYVNLMCTNDPCRLLTAPLRADNNYLTTIKIYLNTWFHNDPTMVINLGVLKKCASLKTLWLNVDSPTTPANLRVRNMELLPKGISSFRFEKWDEGLWTMGTEIYITQQQIRWIVENLRGLESLWITLVIPEETNINEDNAQRDDHNDDDDGGDEDNVQAEQQEDANGLANIDLHMFRELIAMPKLKYLKVIMMNAGALSLLETHGNEFNVRGNVEQVGLDATVNAARDYFNLCEASGYKTIMTSNRILEHDTNTLGFATLTIQRK